MATGVVNNDFVGDACFLAQAARFGKFYDVIIAAIAADTGTNFWYLAENVGEGDQEYMNRFCSEPIDTMDASIAAGGASTYACSAFSPFVTAANLYFRDRGYASINAYLLATGLRVPERFAEAWSAAGGTTITPAYIYGEPTDSANVMAYVTWNGAGAATETISLTAWPSLISQQQPIAVYVSDAPTAGTDKSIGGIFWTHPADAGDSLGATVTTATVAATTATIASTGILALKLRTGDVFNITGTVAGVVRSEQYVATEVTTNAISIATSPAPYPSTTTYAFPVGSVITVIGTTISDYDAGGATTLGTSVVFMNNTLDTAPSGTVVEGVQWLNLVTANTADLVRGQKLLLVETMPSASGALEDLVLVEEVEIATIEDGDEVTLTALVKAPFTSAAVVWPCYYKVSTLDEATGNDLTEAVLQLRAAGTIPISWGPTISRS